MTLLKDANGTAGLTFTDLSAQQASVALVTAAATGVAAVDTANIQAKLTAAAVTGATSVTLREGSYSFTNLTFPVLASGTLKLIGQGIGKTMLDCVGTSGAAITFGDGGGTAAQHMICQDFTLNGGVAAAGNANMDAGVRFNNTRTAVLERVKIEAFTKAGAKSVDILGTGGIANYFGRFSHCQFRNSPIGIYMDGGTGIGANSNYVEYCHFGIHSSYAVQIAAGDANVIFANEFNGSIATGVRIDGNADLNKICFNEFDSPTVSVDIAASTCDRTQLIGNSNMTAVTDLGTNTLRVDADQIKVASNTLFEVPTGLKMGGYTLTLPTDGIGVGGDIRSNSGIYADMSESGELALGARGPSGEAAVQFNRSNAGGITGERIYLAASSRLRTGGKFSADVGLGVGNSAAATEVIGKAVVKKIEIFDSAGSSLGFIPVYSSIT